MGVSEFVAESAQDRDAAEWGRAIGADDVLVTAEYLGTSSGTMGIPIANPPQYGTASTSGTIGGLPCQSQTNAMVPGGCSVPVTGKSSAAACTTISRSWPWKTAFTSGLRL